MEPLSWVEIFGQILWQFVPVWMAMAVIFVGYQRCYKRRLGLYGRLFDSTIGIIGCLLFCFGY